jgi:hypothetical protein
MSKTDPVLAEYIGKEQLAAELQRSPRTLDRWEALGSGPPRTCIGRTVLYRRGSVMQWLAAQEKGMNHGSD